MNRHDYMIELAEKNICDGVLEEPRFYYDSIDIDDGNVKAGSPDVFYNGEQFPVRITHMTMFVRPASTLAVVIGERLIQTIGVRLRGHDTYYMNRQFTIAPLWQTEPTAAAENVTRGCSSWRFERPFILSARDSLRIEVALESAAANGRRCGVGFSGIGLASRRPYFLAADTNLTTVASTQLQTDPYRNDGGEPIVVTDMQCWGGSLNTRADPLGDIRELQVNLAQIGNGTGAMWGVGPVDADPLPQCPATLLGVTSGRAVVHRFPGDGLLWEPGEGITVEAQRKVVTAGLPRLGIALLGYLSVK